MELRFVATAAGDVPDWGDVPARSVPTAATDSYVHLFPAVAAGQSGASSEHRGADKADETAQSTNRCRIRRGFGTGFRLRKCHDRRFLSHPRLNAEQKDAQTFHVPIVPNCPFWRRFWAL
jgi:hypothetical protein